MASTTIPNPVLTTTNNDSFIPVLYAKNYLINEAAQPFSKGIYTDWSFMYSGEGRGGSISIPKSGAHTVADVPTSVAGNQGAIATTPQDPADSSKTITLNKWREVNVFLRKDLKAQAGEMLLRAKLEEMAGVMGEDFDTYIFSLCTGYNSYSTEACTTNTGDNLYTNILNVYNNLNKAKVPMSDRAWIISPTMETRWLKTTWFVSGDYMNDKPISGGKFAGRVLGSPVYVSPLLPASSSSGTTTDTCIYAHKSSLGYCIAFEDFEEGPYDPIQKGRVYSSDILYGATILYPGRGSLFTCTYT